MNMIRQRLVAILVFIVFLFGFGVAQAATVVEQARAVHWTDNNMDALKRIFADTATVNTFLLSFFPNAVPEPDVGEYELVDLHRDGKIQLVITFAYSRAFYNHLYIVAREGGQFQTSEIFTGGAPIQNLKASIVDLNSDGTKQFLLPRYLAPHFGAAQPVPIMIDVYAWNGRQYEAANSSYKNFYRDSVLPRLRTSLDRVQHGQVTKDQESEEILKEKYQKEIEAVNAVVGQ